MKDPYQYERNRTRARELSDTFERAPLDFHTEEERSHIDAEREQHRMAELEDARERRRLLLAEKEAERQAHKVALVKRHERWLTLWHIGLLIGGVLLLVKILYSSI
jgi:hypothetical protein